MEPKVDVAEVVRALMHCANHSANCLECGYCSHSKGVAQDAADLVESLQAQLAEETSRRYQAECNYDHWKAMCAVSEQREKAAVEEIKRIALADHYCELIICVYCKHENISCGKCRDKNSFEWRGPQQAGEVQK